MTTRARHLVFAEEAGPLAGALLYILETGKRLTDADIRALAVDFYHKERQARFIIHTNNNSFWRTALTNLRAGNATRLVAGVPTAETKTQRRDKVRAEYSDYA